MALTAGTRFGPYEIAESIGAGGMGEVYRAHDTTLERDVAVKVLPPSFADDPGRVDRFEREAKTLAALNHPNIAQIYGLEKSDGTAALVMELVEGPTLADRIAKGPLPADEAVGIATQIADALEAAHSQSIIHRDLKPANIKLRSDGTVKVLDFGIAKALAPENLTSGPQSPIMTTPATQVGVILGTAAYMSPEQAKGKVVDQRTDIWAFGCVLYEMLTGQLAFGAEDVPTTLARVIANETNIESLPTVVSPAVRRTIELCLQKDPSKRLHAMADVRLALEGAFESVSPQMATAFLAKPLWRRVLPSTLTALAAVLVTALTALSLWPTPEPPPVNRFDYDLPEGQNLRIPNRRVLALSPDGRHFAYNTEEGLYLRAMGELQARLVPGTEPTLWSPAFSPDGQSMVYASLPGQLRRISISGGAPVVIADAGNSVAGISWEVDGTVFFSDPLQGVLRVSANGGMPELVIPNGEDGTLPYGPELLPDGDSLLFSVGPGNNWDVAQVVVQSLSTGERTVLVEGGSDARYLPTGHLMYALGDGLFALRFELESLSVFGGAVPLVQGVMRAGGATSASANYGVSEDGTLVYATGTVAAAKRTLVWVDRSGREESLDVPPRTYVSPRISPDGTTVALDIRDQDLDIWIWDLARETLTRLTFDPAQDESPVWSPDGQRIAYSSSEGGGSGSETTLFSQSADGTGSKEPLAELAGQYFPTSFLPDATGFLVYGQSAATNSDDISIFRMEGQDQLTPLLETTFEESYPAVSPDGRWMAYVSNESDREEIYVRAFPDLNAGRWQVSTGGGTQPLWASDGEELFYRSGDAVIAVPIQTDPGFRVGNPEVMFEGVYVLEQGGPNYAVSPDERFLMIKDVEDASALTQIVIVENWFEELKRLAPPTP